MVTTDLNSNGARCVDIEAGDVGLDLQGHTVTATNNFGIFSNFSGQNVAIANGTVIGGIAMGGSITNLTVSSMRVKQSPLDGIQVSINTVVTDTWSTNNAGNGIIAAGSGLVVNNSHVNNNGGSGIVGSGGSVTNSEADDNARSGIEVSSMTVMNSTARENGLWGVSINGGSVISSDASHNVSVGIAVQNCPAIIVGNTATRNGVDISLPNESRGLLFDNTVSH